MLSCEYKKKNTLSISDIFLQKDLCSVSIICMNIIDQINDGILAFLIELSSDFPYKEKYSGRIYVRILSLQVPHVVKM